MDNRTMSERQELTVESALEELKAIFPLRMVDVQLRTGPNAKYARIDVWSLGFMRDAPTLTEAVAKVRSWHESQSVKKES